MRLRLIRQTRYQRSDKGKHDGDSACRETHFRLPDSVVPFGGPVRDAVGERAAEVGSYEGADEGGEEDQALCTGFKEVWTFERLGVVWMGGEPDLGTHGGAKSCAAVAPSTTFQPRLRP